MKVKKISAANIEASALPGLFDEEKIDFQPIQYVNWAAYPYKPKVSFRVAHTKDAILLHFKVKEASVRAKYGEDDGSVWTDSCVEFFLIPANDGEYYNIECNCAGTILIGAGATRNGRERAPKEITSLVQRWASLGREPFEERVEDTSWEVALIIPYAVFFKHQIDSLDGKLIKANFYKCGDELQTPHFLSWSPIDIENPDFHRPDFFDTLEFE
ncbi:carbohydrate-binding family 9-like protein [Bacteroides sp.]|uniref:carbohydrate-binding family 9-like protein n=1 Tax=Bacteroides sp. TaxID=29523 RepID=UPI0026336A60|nr:carbohydrate-binding family 9-like protein [Bacteroides sp.]MDD3036380.1 carbohydrate-binding family 9-like protein [Bacteroides sp.]